MNHHGGLAEIIRIPAEWVRPLPKALSPLEAATLGVAGYSTALAIDRLEALGVLPGTLLPLAGSGTTGGVGHLAVASWSDLAMTSLPSAAKQMPRRICGRWARARLSRLMISATRRWSRADLSPESTQLAVRQGRGWRVTRRPMFRPFRFDPWRERPLRGRMTVQRAGQDAPRRTRW